MSALLDKLKRAEGLVARGRATRREFMQLALASGLTLPAASALFVKAARSQPRKGGVLRLAIGQGATTDTLDPATYADQYTGSTLWGALSNSLTEIDAQGNVIGDLAESFEPADGAKRWVFRLRSGVTFHSGKTVTPDDVVASIRHHMGEGSKSAAASLVTNVTDIKADGPDTVLFELNAGNADFPYYMSDYHVPIMPAGADGKADWQSGDRTGPYTLKTFEPGVKSAFSRYEGYFKAQRAHFDRIEALVIADIAARTNALTSGEVDYMDRCDLKTLHLLKRNAGIAISEVTGYGHYVFPMQVTVAPFDNVDVRTALKYSIDREDILKKVFLGYGTVGNDNPIPPSVKFAVDPEPKHIYDPDKARSLIKKAGFDTLKVDLSTAETAFAGSVDAALLWREHAAKAGIDINVVREANDGYWDNVWMKKPFVGGYWGGRPTCDWMFTAVYAADTPWNETQWKNPRFNELLVAARSETDDVTRAGMYGEMQQLVHDDGGLVNVMFTKFVDAHSARLAHDEVAANWPLDGMKIAERWWFAS
ncbi:MAG: ABC transporter substrate-binding protein [Parvibaculaceae bacterium]